MKYLAFDLEIAKEMKEDEDWNKQRPLGITCAATYATDGETAQEKTWANAALGPKMTPAECADLAEYIYRKHFAGYTLVTWNGLAFDLPVLIEEIQDRCWANLLTRVAREHIDPAFHMLCEKGFMCGLNAAAKGLGLQGKTEGMSGALAPVMWKQGREAQAKVLEYVTQDTKVTAYVFEATASKGRLRWISKKGKPLSWRPKAGKLLTVAEAMEIPVPKVTWMTPWPRSQFAGWLEE